MSDSGGAPHPAFPPAQEKAGSGAGSGIRAQRPFAVRQKWPPRKPRGAIPHETASWPIAIGRAFRVFIWSTFPAKYARLWKIERAVAPTPQRIRGRLGGISHLGKYPPSNCAAALRRYVH